MNSPFKDASKYQGLQVQEIEQFRNLKLMKSLDVKLIPQD